MDRKWFGPEHSCELTGYYVNRGAAGVACRTFLGESRNKSNEKVSLDRTLLLPRSPQAKRSCGEKMSAGSGEQPSGSPWCAVSVFRPLSLR